MSDIATTPGVTSDWVEQEVSRPRFVVRRVIDGAVSFSHAEAVEIAKSMMTDPLLAAEVTAAITEQAVSG